MLCQIAVVCCCGLLLLLSASMTAIGQVCPENRDTVYDRGAILQLFADVLNSQIDSGGFRLTDQGTGEGFMVYDLTDTNNYESAGNECIFFYDKHIYHFSSIMIEESYSNIAFLEDGKVEVFKAVNCRDRGDSLGEAVAHIQSRLEKSPDSEAAIDRLRRYRMYGYYVGYDQYSYKVNCDCDPCN